MLKCRLSINGHRLHFRVDRELRSNDDIYIAFFIHAGVEGQGLGITGKGHSVLLQVNPVAELVMSPLGDICAGHVCGTLVDGDVYVVYISAGYGGVPAGFDHDLPAVDA